MTSEVQMPVRVYSSIEKLPGSWCALLEAAGEKNFFLGCDWFANFTATALDASTEPRFYGVEAEDGRPLMIAALQSPASEEGAILRYKIQRSGSLSALANFHSCEFGVALAESADLGETLLKFTAYLRSESPAWSFVEINSLDHDSPLFSSLLHAFRRTGFVVGTRFHFGNWYDRFEVPSYEEYLKSRGAGTRKLFKTYRRLGRNFDKSGKVDFRLFADDAHIEKAIADYNRIHQESWKEPERHKDMVPMMLRSIALTGRLRIGVLYKDDVAVAAIIVMLSGERATIAYTAYDNRFRSYSVGALVGIRMFEHLIEVDGVREIDFGRDDQPYKHHWLPKRRERWGIVAFNPLKLNALRPMFAFFRDATTDRFVKSVKPWVQPILPRLRG